MVVMFGKVFHAVVYHEPRFLTNYRAILILISPSTARRLHYVVLKTVLMYTPFFFFLAPPSIADTSKGNASISSHC